MYSGPKLRSWFTNTQPIEKACWDMAEHGGRRQTEIVKMNTPIDSRTLRDEIHQKLMVVYVNDRGETVYESGSESNIEYAPYVEHGTGLWGPHAAKYEIKPRKPHGWLRWIDPHTGNPVFAKRVMHPGSPGQHMFAIGVAMSEHEFKLSHREHVARCMRDLERNIFRHSVTNRRRVA